MNNILICTDCSENAKKAADQCFYIFQNETKHYLLVNSYNVSNEESNNIIALNDGLKKKVMNRLDSETKRLHKLTYSNTASLNSHTIFGKTENVVNRIIAKNKIDLIVLGNQGENFLSNRLFGSTAEKLISNVSCPKLIVPKQYSKKNNSTQMIIAEEQQLQNMKWWSNVSDMANNQSYNIQLAVIPNGANQSAINNITLPNYINKKSVKVHPFFGKSIGEMRETLNKMVRTEKPSLLNINFSNENLARKIINPSSLKECICNIVPFILQPFEEQLNR